jgi:hypothetical protein
MVHMNQHLKTLLVAAGLTLSISQAHAKPVTGYEGTRDISDSRVAVARAEIAAYLTSGEGYLKFQRDCGYTLPAEVDDDAIRIGAFFTGNDAIQWLGDTYRDLAFMCARMTGHEIYKKAIRKSLKKVVFTGSVKRNFKAQQPSMKLARGILTFGVGTEPTENVVLRVFADNDDTTRNFLKSTL